MKPNIIHSIVVCLAAFALPFMVACSSQEESLPEEISEAILHLNVEPIGQTRAGTATLPDNEKMHSVRVVVLDKNMTIEHNKYYGLEDAQDRKFITLKVKPNEKKMIYLFANEESVSSVGGVIIPGGGTALAAFFNSYTAERKDGFEAEVNKLYFAPDYTKAIPMSSVYEIDFKEGREDYQFYLVRAATKFTCRFKNFRSGTVTVNSISVSEIADKSYLMAHKTNLTMTFTEEGNSISDLFWIDWLKKVSDESQMYPEDNKTLVEKRGWIMDYDIPEEAVQALITQTDLNLSVPKATDTDVNQEQGTLHTFYLPESKNLIKPDEEPYGEQQYEMTLGLTDEYGEQKSFNFAFDNLKALFRNTNVVIDVIMYDREVVVDVIPYSGVVLEPEFGL